MTGQPIFIHSLFRTGSTYVWNKFRQDNRYHCYYEPFHQILAEMAPLDSSPLSGDPNTTRFMGHPDLNRDYLDEYRHLLEEGQKGVPFFQKSFSFDDFCNNHDNPAQKKYVDFLIENTGGKIPLLQFNRSSLRVQWFKKYYPTGLHIYLVRNPDDQFRSYLSMAEEKKLDIFLIMDLITAGVNRNSGLYKELAARVPLFEYHSGCYADEEFVYRKLLPVYSTAEKYFIFYFTWFAAFVENLLHADLVLNMDILSTGGAYRDKIKQQLGNFGIDNIDFSDCSMQEWANDFLPENEREEIRETVQALILKQYEASDIEKIFANLDDENREFYQMAINKWLSLREKQLPGSNLDKNKSQKCELLFQNFSQGAIQLQRRLEGLTKRTGMKQGGLRLDGRVKKSRPGCPLITVITVVLNEPGALRKTMASVFDQTYENIEYIVIDGASSDSTLDVIKEYNDKIDYWLSEPDQGIFDAMNKGIDLASGEWINFMNAGDFFYREDTVKTVFAKEYGEADFIYGDTFFLGGDFHGVVKSWSLDILWKTMVFTHQSLFTHSRILKNRKFDTKLKICADYDIIYGSYMEGRKFFNTDTVIAAFDPGFSEVSRSRMAYEKWQVVKKYRRDFPFYRFYVTLFLKRLYRDLMKRLAKSKMKNGK